MKKITYFLIYSWVIFAFLMGKDENLKFPQLATHFIEGIITRGDKKQRTLAWLCMLEIPDSVPSISS